jgi:hypothetical protein
MDTIYYGADLAHYIRHETRLDWDDEAEWPPIKTIPFWSRAVAFNAERFTSGRGFAFFNRNSVLPE